MKKPKLPRLRRRLEVTGNFGQPRPARVYKIDGKRYLLTHYSLDMHGELNLSFLRVDQAETRCRVG